ncbi:Canalicular multispecific organic anion transporter 1, partial [Coemansia sp. RSA 2706]
SEYSDKELLSAISKAHINNLLNTDDSKGQTGLLTEVEDNGQNFSVGQRQLISLCRALLWKRKIVILDEATANIDTRTDQLMQSIIRKELSECTVLTIAHRLKTVMDSDRIMVMDQGKCVEFDTPSNLLARDGHFSKLVKSMEFNESKSQT